MFRASAEPEAALKRKPNIVNMLESRPFEPRGRLPASPDPGGPGCQHGGGTSTCDQHQDHTRRSDLGVHHVLDELQDAAYCSGDSSRGYACGVQKLVVT